MSVWNEIRKKSLGARRRIEDIASLYPEGHRAGLISEENINGNKYEIKTNGSNPYIVIQLKNHKTPISMFSSYNKVTLDIDGEDYEVEVDRVADQGYYFSYQFNKETDYVYGEHDGKTWTLDEIKELAEKIINVLLTQEDKLFDYMK